MSAESYKARKVLNRLPKNLINLENQNNLKAIMSDYFVDPRYSAGYQSFH